MKHVVLINAHWSNRGDEAAIRAILDSLLQNISEVKITVIFKESGDIHQFPYTNSVDYITSKFLPTFKEVIMALLFNGKFGCISEIRKNIEIISNADYVIYAPGGAVISDRFWWRKQLEYLFPVAYAQKRNIPVFFAAPSVGPFQKKRFFRNFILKRVDCICVREPISATEMKNQGIKKNVSVTIDSAFLNSIDRESSREIYEKNKELKSFIDTYPKVVGITITDFGWHVEYGKDERLKEQIRNSFLNFINQLRVKGVGVLLIPQLFGNQNDSKFLEIFQMENTYVLSDGLDAYFQQYIISKLYAIVGMRYHSNIFAAKMGVPFVPIVYEEKMEGFLYTAKLLQIAINLKELSEEKLMEHYLLLEENYDYIKKLLEENQVVWRAKAKQTQCEMLGLIQSDGEFSDVKE